jgi:hypothetical protein
VWWNEAKIQYSIKMYYLVVGQFIYTQSEYEKWVLGAAESHYQPSFWEAWANSIDQWITGTLMNPFTYLWIGIAAFFIIMVVVAIVAIRAPGALTRGKKQ